LIILGFNSRNSQQIENEIFSPLCYSWCRLSLHLVLHIFIEGKLLRESNVDYEVAPHVVATVQERFNQRSDQQEPQEQQDGSSANSASNSTSTNAVQNIKKAAVCYQQQLLNLHLLKNLNLHLSPADKIPIL
jgi:hypothetical protein